MKFSDRSSRLNENSLYRLKKEVDSTDVYLPFQNNISFSFQVNQLSYIIKSVEAFLNINTRLVVLIDGLDVCEQQRILQILDVNQINDDQLLILHLSSRFLASACPSNERK